MAMKIFLSGISESLSKRADRVADIILQDSDKDKDAKAKQVTRETVSMFKDVTHHVKTNLKVSLPQNFFRGAAYNAGRISGRTQKACCSLLSSQFKEIDRKKVSFQDIGQQFYVWSKGHKIRFEYKDNKTDAELEIERIVDLIGYMEKKKDNLRS